MSRVICNKCLRLNFHFLKKEVDSQDIYPGIKTWILEYLIFNPLRIYSFIQI